MARDPDLQRFAGTRIRRHVVGQFHTVLQWRSVCIGIPWQHLNKVLHFVCELRESRGEVRVVAMTLQLSHQPMHPIFTPWCAGTSRHGRFLRKHVPDSDPGCALQSTSMPAFHRRNVPNCKPMVDGGMRKYSAGACPPLGSGWGVAESAVPIRCSKPQLRLFIPWCAGTSRNGQLVRKHVPDSDPGWVVPVESPPTSSFSRKLESRGGERQDRHTIGESPASQHFHSLMRPSEGHGDSCESLPRTPIRGQESRGVGGGETAANLTLVNSDDPLRHPSESPGQNPSVAYQSW